MPYLFIVAAIFMADLWIKNKIEKYKTEASEEKVLGGRVILTKYHNKGAFLNLGEKKRNIVAVVSLLFSAAMFVYFLLTLTTKGNKMLKTGLAFLLGGAFSNTYDRWKRKYVVDYLQFAFKSPRIRNVVYNISDFFIMIGALLFTLAHLR